MIFVAFHFSPKIYHAIGIPCNKELSKIVQSGHTAYGPSDKRTRQYINLLNNDHTSVISLVSLYFCLLYLSICTSDKYCVKCDFLDLD